LLLDDELVDVLANLIGLATHGAQLINVAQDLRPFQREHFQIIEGELKRRIA
jgi:hypothetical protein